MKENEWDMIHLICSNCWCKKNPEKTPYKTYKQESICCVCNKTHENGAFAKINTEITLCKGNCGDIEQNPKHGNLYEKGTSRWCDYHNGFHGYLYNCKYFPTEIRQQIKRMDEKYKKNLSSPEWIKDKIDSGLPPLAISFMKMFAGIK